jgi:hypothetical protein
MALHQGQLAIHIGEAGGTLGPWLRESSVGGFAESLHGAGAEATQRFRGYRGEGVSRALVVREMVLAEISFGPEGVGHVLRVTRNAYPGHLPLSLDCKYALSSAPGHLPRSTRTRPFSPALPLLRMQRALTGSPTWGFLRPLLRGGPNGFSNSAPVLFTSGMKQRKPF